MVEGLKVLGVATVLVRAYIVVYRVYILVYRDIYTFIYIIQSVVRRAEVVV